MKMLYQTIILMKLLITPFLQPVFMLLFDFQILCPVSCLWHRRSSRFFSVTDQVSHQHTPAYNGTAKYRFFFSLQKASVSHRYLGSFGPRKSKVWLYNNRQKCSFLLMFTFLDCRWWWRIFQTRWLLVVSLWMLSSFHSQLCTFEPFQSAAECKNIGLYFTVFH